MGTQLEKHWYWSEVSMCQADKKVTTDQFHLVLNAEELVLGVDACYGAIWKLRDKLEAGDE